MSTASDQLALYLAAETAVLKGQQFRLGDKQVTFANLADIRAGRQEWQRAVNAELAAAAGANRGPLSQWGTDLSFGTVRSSLEGGGDGWSPN